MSNIKLTTQKDWENKWNNVDKMSVDAEKSLLHFFQTKLFEKKLPFSKKAFLEIGCAPGRYLKYFKNKFGYNVTGIDYSKDGIEITKKNMKMSNIEATIIHADFTNYKFLKNYDIIFSAGFIEHFTNPTIVISKMVSIVKPGGLILATIPNFSGILGLSRKIFEPDIYKLHNPLSTNDIEHIFKSLGLVNVEVGPLGNPVIPGPSKRNVFYKIISSITSIINKILESIYRKKNVNLEHPFFSPQLYVLARKPN